MMSRTAFGNRLKKLRKRVEVKQRSHAGKPRQYVYVGISLATHGVTELTDYTEPRSHQTELEFDQEVTGVTQVMDSPHLSVRVKEEEEKGGHNADTPNAKEKKRQKSVTWKNPMTP